MVFFASCNQRALSALIYFHRGEEWKVSAHKNSGQNPREDRVPQTSKSGFCRSHTKKRFYYTDNNKVLFICSAMQTEALTGTSP
jgi:hypothetical protein